MDSMRSVSEARYCWVQRWIWRWMYWPVRPKSPSPIAL